MNSMKSHTCQSLLFLLLLFLSPPLIPFAGAQQQPATDSTSSDGDSSLNATNIITPSMAAIVLILIIIFFVTGTISIYIQHCAETSSSSAGAGEGRRSRREIKGLDKSAIESFPTFPYSEVRELKLGKGSSLECAICLSEFEDNENLRLIPKCDHVFHPDCIDTWLAGHVTCPVCRANLVTGNSAESTHRVDSDISPELSSEEIPRRSEEVRVTIDDEGVANESQMPKRNRNNNPKFPRSHSTGHDSVSQLGGEEDWERFTLRLPAEVRRQVVARARLKRATSLILVALPRESSSRRGGGDGEGSGSSRYGGRLFGRRGLNFLLTPFVSRGAGSVRSTTKVVVDDGDVMAGSVGSTKRFGGTAVTPLESLPHAPA